MNAEIEKLRAKFKILIVIGGVDCTHVEIKKPKVHGDCYINRKIYAIHAVCNEEEFTSEDATSPGSVHDSRI